MARTLIGNVTSEKGDKTIVITVHTRKTHPIYKKQYSVTQKIMAHDEKNEARLGDRVEITECRPLSARKRFTLSKVVETAKILHVEEESKVESPKLKDEDKAAKTSDKKLESAPSKGDA